MPHINSETNPPPPIVNVAFKYLRQFLAQASVLLLFRYAATLSKGEGPDLFLQSEPFQSFQNFFQELTWSQYCCEILKVIRRKCKMHIWAIYSHLRSRSVSDHSFIPYANFSEKLTFPTPSYAAVRVRFRK